MNQDSLNIQVRKFLKKVGINSQRNIEQAVQQAIQEGKIKEGDELDASMTLSVAGLDLNVTIEDTIKID